MANTALADAISRRPGAPEVHLLVDNGCTDNPTHSGPQRFPIRALGRFVHPSLFDHIITLSALDLSSGDAEHDATEVLEWLDRSERVVG
jgi:hypothetical protein